MPNDTVRLRIRWRRWLGQKTRWDKPYWVTLLDSRYASWANKILHGDGISIPRFPSKRDVWRLWRKAIDKATLEQLLALDEICVTDKLGL